MRCRKQGRDQRYVLGTAQLTDHIALVMLKVFLSGRVLRCGPELWLTLSLGCSDYCAVPVIYHSSPTRLAEQSLITCRVFAIAHPRRAACGCSPWRSERTARPLGALFAQLCSSERHLEAPELAEVLQVDDQPSLRSKGLDATLISVHHPQ